MATADMEPRLDSTEEALSFAILNLQNDCDAEQFNLVVKTLRRIITNVINNPSEEKYRELKLSNKTFSERVWKFSGAQQFLFATGWCQVDDKVMLIEDMNISCAARVLEQSGGRTGQVNGAVQTRRTEPKTEKEKQLEDIRRRQMEQMKKDKEEKKRIADMIKADRRETGTRESKDSVARHVNTGAQIKRFGDIGVDLNAGGG